jgi:hypothetical protein
MFKKILFVHLPKTGGVYIQNVLESNDLGASIGHFSLHDICDPNKRALLCRFLDKASNSMGQENIDELSSMIEAGDQLNMPENNYIVSTAIRNPYAWYKSMYQYLVRRDFGECVCGILGRLDWEQFVGLLLSPSKIAAFSDKYHDFFRPQDLFENMVLDYRRCPLNIGLYSYIVLSHIFCRDVFDYSVDEIISSADDLILIPKEYMLRTEHLKSDFVSLIGDTENGRCLHQIDSFPNTSPELVTVSERQKQSLYEQDRLIFKIFGYDEDAS